MRDLHHPDLMWAVRRLPRGLREALEDTSIPVFIAGGFIRSCIANEPVNDIDLFVPSKAQAETLLNELFGSLNQNCGLVETDNAFTITSKPYHIQVIHRWVFDSPEDCIRSFDFTIARAAIWFDGERWQGACDEQFYTDLAAKRLVYCSPDRIEEAGGSMLRVLKFYQRGYRIPLDSLSAVIARLCSGVEGLSWKPNANESLGGELGFARLLCGLLREVDPLIDPTHAAHLPGAGEAA